MKRAGGRNFYLLVGLIHLLFASSFQAATNILHEQFAAFDTKKLNLTEAEKEWIRQHPVVRWGADPDWPPFSTRDDNTKIWGVDSEIVDLVAKRTGIKIVWVPTTSWSDTYRKLIAHEIDFTSGTAESPDRKDDVIFTSPYCSFPVAIITRKDMPFLTSVDQLATKRISAAADHVTTHQLKKDYPNATILVAPSTEEALLKVSGREADGMIANLAVASYLVHTRGVANVKISGLTGYDFPLRLAIRRDMPELAKIFDKAIDSISPHEKELIYGKYIHPEIQPALNWATWRHSAIYAIVIGAVALAIVSLWNLRMAKEIRTRQTIETALREATEKLKKQTTELHERVTEVESLNKKLVTANKELESFSYSVSHDLRSPLRHVSNFADILQSDDTSTLSEDGQLCVNTIKRESDYMQRMIDDLLTYARLGRVPMKYEDVDMRELVDATINSLQLESSGHEILWKVEPLPHVNCDPNLLRQVLANLLSNAIKFTRGKTPAIIEIGSLPASEKERTFYIR